MGLKDRIFPKESNFHKMLTDQCSKTLEGIERLEAFVGNQNKENASKVKNIEREADELRRILVEESEVSDKEMEPRGHEHGGWFAVSTGNGRNP